MGSWTDELREVVWLEGSEGYGSLTDTSCLELWSSGSHNGRNSLEDLNSVDRGRGFGRRGITEVLKLAGEMGAEDKDRATPGEDRGRPKFNGIAVGDGVETWTGVWSFCRPDDRRS